MNGLIKVTPKDIDSYTEKAIASIDKKVDGEVPREQWKDTLFIAQLYVMIGADFDMGRVNFSDVWYEDIKKFDRGYFYEYAENKYILIEKGLKEVRYAKVNLR